MNRADLKNLVYMQIAKTLSQLSTCNRLKVGAVLLGYDGSVVGTGYNGSLPGLTHCDEASCNANQRCLRTRHAERSALDYSQARVATAYVTHELCLRCTQDLIARGCKVIYFEVVIPKRLRPRDNRIALRALRLQRQIVHKQRARPVWLLS